MERILKGLTTVGVLALAAMLAFAILQPIMADWLGEIFTDKAELERAKGERAILEASADAVRADSRIVSVLVGMLALMGLSQSITFSVLVVVLAKERRA